MSSVLQGTYLSSLEREFLFTFSRSRGPGGQNVNKVNSRATLSWDLEASTCLSEVVKQRFRDLYPNLITNEGLVIIHSDEYRDQKRNIEACKEKLYDYLTLAKTPPKKRVPTKPSRAKKASRVADKRQHGAIKKLRRISKHDD